MATAFVLALVAGGVILGWLARARLNGLSDNVDLIDRGEVGDTKNGD